MSTLMHVSIFGTEREDLPRRLSGILRKTVMMDNTPTPPFTARIVDGQDADVATLRGLGFQVEKL